MDKEHIEFADLQGILAGKLTAAEQDRNAFRMEGIRRRLEHCQRRLEAIGKMPDSDSKTDALESLKREIDGL